MAFPVRKGEPRTSPTLARQAFGCLPEKEIRACKERRGRHPLLHGPWRNRTQNRYPRRIRCTRRRRKRRRHSIGKVSRRMQSHRWRIRSSKPGIAKDTAPVPTKAAISTKASGKETKRTTIVVFGGLPRHPGSGQRCCILPDPTVYPWLTIARIQGSVQGSVHQFSCRGGISSFSDHAAAQRHLGPTQFPYRFN